MTKHKFVVGQTVYFLPNRFEDRSARGVYTVEKLLPEIGSVPQYHVRSDTDGHIRIARENQLVEELPVAR